MSDERPLRLFVAASVPEHELAWLREATEGLRDRWPGARWTSAENQHVTLKFLGSTPPDRLSDLLAACSAVAEQIRPSELALEGLGAFPSRTRARVLWAGIHDPALTLTAAAAALDDRLAPLGYTAEKRAFTPHLTLARFRSPVRIGVLPDLPPTLAFPLNGFGLWRSHLSPRGARYEQLRNFDFGHAE